jgi:hypothetical protein
MISRSLTHRPVISVSACALLGLGAAFLMGAAGATRAAGASQWDIIQISGSSQFNPATNLYTGSGTIVIDGTSSPVTWESVVLGTISAEADGTLHLIGSHTFTSTTPGRRFEFTTFDTVTAVPTSEPGIFTLTSHLKIEDGSGLYGQGQIVAANGTANFATGSVTIPVAVGKLARH